MVQYTLHDTAVAVSSDAYQVACQHHHLVLAADSIQLHNIAQDTISFSRCMTLTITTWKLHDNVRNSSYTKKQPRPCFMPIANIILFYLKMYYTIMSSHA
jgi:hypothetical protein